jgi:hypothetical protein
MRYYTEYHKIVNLLAQIFSKRGFKGEFQHRLSGLSMKDWTVNFIPGRVIKRLTAIGKVFFDS